ncbi:TfoX/Sxy family protein [Occallatibacter savannae]|uniref:TfoX/Sxy family protein n=1 Tax=Occallatibacter savannae TaxID=1002691 RepID=UPI0013A5AF32|nr:TfoX/Sxy family protein [Occallatibacter savannae]
MPNRPGAKRPIKRKSPPYPFLIEALAPLDPEVRPMFSGFAIYADDKILAMLRDSPKHPEDNGVWLVFSETADPADPKTSRDFPSLRNINLLGGKITHWRLIPADSPAFESEALHACDLLLRRDARFGRIPKSRKPRSARRRSTRS